MSEIRSQATPAKDELERSAIGWQQYISRALGCKPGQLTYQLEECIEKIEALKPRTVNSAAELDALPVGSVLARNLDHPDEMDVYVKRSDTAGWRYLPLPMTVLFTPGEAG